MMHGLSMPRARAVLPGGLTEISASMDEPVIMACRTGKCPADAAALFREGGLRDAHVPRRRMKQWNSPRNVTMAMKEAP